MYPEHAERQKDEQAASRDRCCLLLLEEDARFYPVHG